MGGPACQSATLRFCTACCRVISEFRHSSEFGFVRRAGRRYAVILSRCCTVAVRRQVLIDDVVVIEFKFGSGVVLRLKCRQSTSVDVSPPV